ncbi:hypothetical protein, partial [Sunxiuqinia sp. sy24]|uniref:hypothetical protein n=1 Tax=Sunxiuqinia sp. sy24 TaxID=3461495 RepID=UPI004045BCDE
GLFYQVKTEPLINNHLTTNKIHTKLDLRMKYPLKRVDQAQERATIPHIKVATIERESRSK